MNGSIKAALLAASAMLMASACSQNQNDAAENVAVENEAAVSDSLEGTWKTDMASIQVEEKPTTLLLKDGEYSCKTCVPPLTVKADGAFHPVADRPYYDSISVKVVDDKTVLTTRKKGDRQIGETKMTASEDGNTLTFEFKDSATPNAPVLEGKSTDTRVAAGPAGSHAISGDWKSATFDSMSEEGLTQTFDIEGDTLTMTTPAGQSYTAKFGGPDVPIKGDTGGTVVSIERLGENSFRENNKRNGKVVNVTTFTVVDGKLNVVSENKRTSSTFKFTADRQ